MVTVENDVRNPLFGCHSERLSEEALSRRANRNDPKEIPRLSARNDSLGMRMDRFTGSKGDALDDRMSRISCRPDRSGGTSLAYWRLEVGSRDPSAALRYNGALPCPPSREANPA
jgi:hypothetical protein